jgi:taurine dioxygenase
MHCTPLDAPFGARLHLDVDPHEAPLSETARRELRALFAEHELLVLKTGPLTDQAQVELLSALGRIEPDDDGAPMRMEVTNQHEFTTAPDGELIFHYDYAYDPAPIPGISMYGALIAEGATPTLFASSSNVLSRLPRSLVEDLRNRVAAHACFLPNVSEGVEGASEPAQLIARGQPGWGPNHYWTHHPAIFKNQYGVETLFLCLQHTDRILGVPGTESDRLLEQIFAHLYDPAQIYEHVWESHDLVIWDNLTVQHARPDPTAAPRTLRRYHLSETNLTSDYIRVAREQGIM